MIELKRGPWKLADLESVPKNGLKPEMMAIYKANHNPKYSFLMGVQDFNKLPRKKIPAELFKLDILDGSPPCSSFSMAGSREKAWGTNKKFREGQTTQVLDDLFFHFIETARILQPKVVVAENVKGLVIGKAKGYVKQIFNLFNLAGYETQLFLLNASRMGVPQARERTVFVARRKSLGLPKLVLKFSEDVVTVKEAFQNLPEEPKHLLTSGRADLWRRVKVGNNFSTVHPNGSDFGTWKVDPNRPLPTLLSAGGAGPTHWIEPRWLNKTEYIRVQSFPDDFNFVTSRPQYVCGMSVPPFMMQRVANAIHEQLLTPLGRDDG